MTGTMITGPGPRARLDQDRNLPALGGEGLLVRDTLPKGSPGLCYLIYLRGAVGGLSEAPAASLPVTCQLGNNQSAT